ncbi:hypothetical protein EV182_008190 [Spiromyces aspiralis]|uniref:Uncharacterized protein n=1 Tax=Spiromyces aspiralis TaxID=68401 RepID=A0ACC1HK86_9FUNG|nr:hypothetical protein EV182_008190 [Spiromyces aspiralis]
MVDATPYDRVDGGDDDDDDTGSAISVSYITSNATVTPSSPSMTVLSPHTSVANRLDPPSTLSPMALDSRNPFPPNHILSIIMGWMGLDPESFFAPVFPVLSPDDIAPSGRWHAIADMVQEYWENPERHHTVWDQDDLLRYFPTHWWQGFKPASGGPLF